MATAKLKFFLFQNLNIGSCQFLEAVLVSSALVVFKSHSRPTDCRERIYFVKVRDESDKITEKP